MYEKFYVGNIPFSSTEAELELFFQEHLGKDVRIKASIQVDEPTQRLRGFAFVRIEAKVAGEMDKLDGEEFKGRSLVIDAVGVDS